MKHAAPEKLSALRIALVGLFHLPSRSSLLDEINGRKHRRSLQPMSARENTDDLPEHHVPLTCLIAQSGRWTNFHFRPPKSPSRLEIRFAVLAFTPFSLLSPPPHPPFPFPLLFPSSVVEGLQDGLSDWIDVHHLIGFLSGSFASILHLFPTSFSTIVF